MLDSLIEFEQLASRILGGPVETMADGIVNGLGAFLVAVGGLLLAWAVCWLMYRQKIFLRL